MRVTQKVAARAIRRLNLLEWVIMGGAGLIAVFGGALVSWLIAAQLKVSLRHVVIISVVRPTDL